MNSQRGKYWFPAKRYGWGWGLPTCWQGALVLVVYAALLGLGIIFLRGEGEVTRFITLFVSINAGLLLMCWLKGEPPRWRWGRV